MILIKILRSVIIAAALGALISITIAIVYDVNVAYLAGYIGTVLAVPFGLFIGIRDYLRYRRWILFTSLNLDKLPQQAQRYIAKVGGCIGYKLTVRREVMNELADEFEEQIRRCYSEEEKQKRIAQTIECFGDPRLLGKLIRRAKKRCRPVWKKAIVRSLQGVGVLLVLFILYTGWFITGTANPKVDYLARLNQLARPEIRAEDNAWKNYQRGLELMIQPDEKISDKTGRRLTELSQEEWIAIEKWIAENEESWAQFVAGSKKPYYYREYEVRDNKEFEPPLLAGVLLPPLADFRRMAHIMRFRADLALEQGDIESAAENALASLCLGHHFLHSSPILVEQLVGIAVSSIGMEMILEIAPNADTDFLYELQSNMPVLYFEELLKTAYTGEKYLILDAIQRTFTDSGVGGGHLIPHNMKYILPLIGNDKHFFSTIMASISHARRDATEAKVAELFDRIEKITELTPYQRHIEDKKFDYDIEASMLANRYTLISVLMADFGRVMHLHSRLEANYRAVLTVLAIKRYEMQKGHLPDSLDELVQAGYLDAVPMDPFGPGQLNYRRVDGDFVLYSFGSNFTDNGGQFVYNDKGEVVKFPSEGDYVFWPLANDS